MLIDRIITYENIEDSKMIVEAYARTDVGPVRENNEDNMLLMHEELLFVVADGMGGHAAGEIASDIAVIL